MELPEDFLVRMQGTLKEEYPDFLACYDNPPYRGIHVNTLKTSSDEIRKRWPYELQQTKWDSNGFYIKDEKLGKTLLYNAGLIYPQEPSAMSAVPYMDIRPGLRVLDLCAAPGGKSLQIAQKLQGLGLLVCNEYIESRARILLENMERAGVKNAVITNESPAALADGFYGYFDRILVDAPCSGEGMFRKEEEAIINWSLKNVSSCAKRQRDILECAYRMLAPGGKLVYSTCTFSEDEDEHNVYRFLNSHDDLKVQYMHKLLPHKVMGEGHFVCVIGKDETYFENYKKHMEIKADRRYADLFTDFQEEYMHTMLGNLVTINEDIYSVPRDCPSFNGRILRAGIHLGHVVKDRFEPSHHLAMCLTPEEVDTLDVDDGAAYEYLKGMPLVCDEDGYKVVMWKGHPLGWVKCVQGVAKNHLPKGLRIR